MQQHHQLVEARAELLGGLLLRARAVELCIYLFVVLPFFRHPREARPAVLRPSADARPSFSLSSPPRFLSLLRSPPKKIGVLGRRRSGRRRRSRVFRGQVRFRRQRQHQRRRDTGGLRHDGVGRQQLRVRRERRKHCFERRERSARASLDAERPPR